MGFDTSLFVQQPVGSHLICAICHDVHEKPTSVCDNGHLYCEKCIETWVKNSRGVGCCPDCRLPVHANRSLCRPLETVIMSMKVRCLQKDEEKIQPAESEEDEAPATTIPQLFKRARRASEGKASASASAKPCCGWEGSLEEYLKKHIVSECLFAKKPCDLCKELVKLPVMAKHKANECPRRLVSCSLCKIRLVAVSKDVHDRDICPEKIVACSGCGAVFRREDLGTVKLDPLSLQLRTYTGHLNVCPKLMVPCQFARHGCGKKVKREDMDKHDKESAGSHAKLLNAALLRMETKMLEGNRWEEVFFEWIIPRSKLEDIASTNGLVSECFCPREDLPSFHVGLFAGPENSRVEIKLFSDCSRQAPWIDQFSVSFVGGGHLYCGSELQARAMQPEDPDEYWFTDSPEDFIYTYTAILAASWTLATLKETFGEGVQRKLAIKFGLKPPHAVLTCLRTPSAVDLI